MIISANEWAKYVKGLSAVNKEATDQVAKFLGRGFDYNNPEDMKQLVSYAYGISTKYGEAAAELACQMYDAVGLASGMILEAAVPAEVASYGEVAKTVYGTAKSSQNIEEMSSAVGRLVKRAGQDTTLKNALRDGAQFAWVPSGDTCAFCITLASRGWQNASKNAIKGGHAEHIHSNCDCAYAIRFDNKTQVKGYDPDRYYQQYKNAEGDTPKEKINSMRRRFYAENKRIVGAESSKAEEFIPKSFKLEQIAFKPAETIAEAETYAKNEFVKGGFNLTGKDVSYKGIDVDIANSVNKRLGEIYNSFDIPKLSSLESYGKADKRAWGKSPDAPMFTTNFGNVGLNNTLVKSQQIIDNYNDQAEKAFKYVSDNVGVLTGESRSLAEAYISAGRDLVGNSVEDFITHEIGHHISYSIPEVNKELSQIQKATDWKETASKLSGYANKSFGEYFAESFTAYCNGEQEMLQPEIISIFEKLRKQS